MFNYISELIEYHGRFTSTYCSVLKEQAGCTLYIQLRSENPKYSDYYYKISGDIKFENIDWDDTDDGIRKYQVWEIKQKSKNCYYIIFDIGAVDLIADKVKITRLTKNEYISLDQS